MFDAFYELRRKAREQVVLFPAERFGPVGIVRRERDFLSDEALNACYIQRLTLERYPSYASPNFVER